MERIYQFENGRYLAQIIVRDENVTLAYVEVEPFSRTTKACASIGEALEDIFVTSQTTAPFCLAWWDDVIPEGL